MKPALTLKLVILVAFVIVTAAAGQIRSGTQGTRLKKHFDQASPRPVPGRSPQFGDPLPDLTAEQLAAFEAGREEFESEETAADGLGPIFNNVSCAACHSDQTSGGASAILETRFGRTINGQFDPLTSQGGSLQQQMAIDPAALETIPAEANTVAQRQSTPLFGAGLIDAIPDSTIQQNALRRQPDGVAGRAAVVFDVVSGQSRIGRFGWKAQQASLLAFAADAYLNEMGITSRFFPTDNAPNGNTALLAKFDAVADPEDVVDPVTGTGDIDKSTEFMRLLAAPPPLRMNDSAAAGRKLFEQAGCAACHEPVMFTGPNRIAALDNKRVALYSDLLLHDMGALGDGIAQAAAGPRDMRTAPLWGLRASAPYLHDGRAASVDEAIRAHDGEGARARNRYIGSTAAQQQQLLDFLGTL